MDVIGSGRSMWWDVSRLGTNGSSTMLAPSPSESAEGAGRDTRKWWVVALALEELLFSAVRSDCKKFFGSDELVVRLSSSSMLRYGCWRGWGAWLLLESSARWMFEISVSIALMAAV